ncbi:MAG TPA: YhcH/YjgK/YiaL family protein [Pirellulales bacterium]|jgi:YhcH/YjgK/YiaL family protein|nr:YhcH/YjgK/YiaL family protein [Pirellulales bacterium]
MLLDVLANVDRYRGAHPGLAAGFEYLSTQRWRELPPGKHALDRDRLLLIIERVQAKGRDRARLETHRRFIDIQLCVEGAEVIGWKPLAACRELTDPYHEGRDIAFYGDRPDTWLELDGDKFLVFFPDDAHAPLAGIGELHKAIMKVAVDY